MDLIPLMSPTDVAVIITQDGGTFGFSSKVADVLAMMIEDELDDDASPHIRDVLRPELEALLDFIGHHIPPGQLMCTGNPTDTTVTCQGMVDTEVVTQHGPELFSIDTDKD